MMPDLQDKTPKDPEPIKAKKIDPMLGKTAGNYRIESLLGSGGMGAVYKAFHPGLDRWAAVKFLRPELSEEPGIVERFFREAKATNQIKHPGIVDIFDLGSMADGRCYMVMQLLEGESLEQYAKRQGILPESVVTALGRKILDILAVAHKKGIIHRDLKPANIFLEQTIKNKTTVKLLDFGIAKILAGAPGIASTAESTILGTPRYMPPEQARSPSSIDPRADFYSLGAILYELATGRQIFDAKSPIEMIQRHQKEMPTPPRKIRPQLSKEFEVAVLRALSKDPKDRFPDCESFIIALNTGDQTADDDQGDDISTLLDINSELSFEPDVGNTLDLIQRAPEQADIGNDVTLPPVEAKPTSPKPLWVPPNPMAARTDIDPVPANESFAGASAPNMSGREETAPVVHLQPARRSLLWPLLILAGLGLSAGGYFLIQKTAEIAVKPTPSAPKR